MAKRTPKIDAAAAEQCGRIACREGRIRAPIADKVYREELLAKYMGADEMQPKVTAARRAIGMAWLRGWDRENMAMPI